MLVRKFYDKEKAIAYAEKLIDEGEQGNVRVDEVRHDSTWVNENGEVVRNEGWRQYQVHIGDDKQEEQEGEVFE